MDSSLRLPLALAMDSSSKSHKSSSNNMNQSTCSILTLKHQHGLQESPDEHTFVGSETSTTYFDDGDSSCSSDDDDDDYSEDSYSCLPCCDSHNSSSNSFTDTSDDDSLDDLEKELFHFDITRRRASASMVPNRSPALRALETTRSRGGRKSMPNLPSQDHQTIQQRMEQAQANAYYQSPESMTTAPPTPKGDETEDKYASTRPVDFLEKVLQGITYSTVQTTAGDYFVPVTKSRVASHSLSVSQAIRQKDVSKLRRFAQKGIPLDGCNRQGESIPHLACRLNHLPLIEFLLQEAQVSFRVRDDAGRTPFHDSCWTTQPNFDVVKLLLRDSPELLFCKDKRGFTPLHYIPHPCWKEWNCFFEQQQSALRLSVQYTGFARARDQLNETQQRLQALMKSQMEYCCNN